MHRIAPVLFRHASRHAQLTQRAREEKRRRWTCLFHLLVSYPMGLAGFGLRGGNPDSVPRLAWLPRATLSAGDVRLGT